MNKILKSLLPSIVIIILTPFIALHYITMTIFLLVAGLLVVMATIISSCFLWCRVLRTRIKNRS